MTESNHKPVKSLAVKGDAGRKEALEKQRTTMLSDFEKQKAELAAKSQVKIGSDKFVSETDYTDNALKAQTVGLVHLEDFQRIREDLDKQRLEQLQGGQKDLKGGEKKRKKKKADKVKLSFDFDDEDENGDGEEQEDGGSGSNRNEREESNGAGNDDSDSSSRPTKKLKKLGKDPSVDTSFLPDAEREAQEAEQRALLQKKWLEEQEKIKKESIHITYSFWDGSGHRKSVTCKKGDTIAQFLEKAKAPFSNLKGVHVDNLLYIKEDLIIPHHHTFYDFLINKTRGKSGPLFDFEVRDDVRLQNDARIETVESHAGKVVERSWYEKNKHIFPASRWELFDPTKDYGKYSIKDRNKKKEEEQAKI